MSDEDIKKKMYDKDITKALSCCVKGDCFRCPLYYVHNCRTVLREEMNNILNKQQIELVLKRNTINDLNNKLTEKQSENEKLQSLCTSKDVIIKDQQAEIEKLENAIIALMSYLDILGADKTDTSFINQATEFNKQIRADIKSEAIKEFAERLKKEAVTKCDWDNCVDVEDIDKLVAEMVGEQNV